MNLNNWEENNTIKSWYKRGLTAIIILLFFGLSLTPTLGFSSNIDDNTPPITICTLNPSEPTGNGHWYITNINVTLNAMDDISGVKEIHYRLDEGEWIIHYGNFLIFVLDHDCLKNGTIEYFSIDNVGNQEEIKRIEGIYIDQEPPYSDISIKKEGNPQDGWLITINVSNIKDDCSGVYPRVRFLLNGVEQDTAWGPGPIYTWSFIFHGGLKITIGVQYCDIAGNCVTEEIDLKLSRDTSIYTFFPLFKTLLERFPILNLLLQRWRI